MIDVISMLESMAQNGQAPEHGCAFFSVGYESAFDRIKETYLLDQFPRGRSAEKFVIGPYGSGKTHFLRQLSHIGREHNCVSSEVHLNKDVDFIQRLIVYKEVVRALRVPGEDSHGIRSLLRTALQRVQAAAPDEKARKIITDGWISAIERRGFEDVRYARQLKRALMGLHNDDNETFESSIRWLEGEVKDRQLCKELREQPIPAAEENLFANRALFSLFQFIRHAKFTGTIVGYDEAEQGFAVDRKKMNKILSMLQASINATAQLKDGSVLIVYALTPDMMEKMSGFQALQQRIDDPMEGAGFFDGNVYACKIDLTKRTNPEEELRLIGLRLVALFYEHIDRNIDMPQSKVETAISDLANKIAERDATSSNRRSMTKLVSACLLQLYRTGRMPADIIEDEKMLTATVMEAEF